MKGAIAPDGDVHTPYGATEALPVASIAASEIWDQVMEVMSPAQNVDASAGRTFRWGTCVGRCFPGIEWRVIRITDDPIGTMDEAEELPPGQIGELVVRGPVVTTEYVTRTEANALHKIRDGETFWHRMGDVGYLQVAESAGVPCDTDDTRSVPTSYFWFCGRKSHRVITADGTLFTIPCEAIFNRHRWIYRSALVGVGPRGRQRPVMFVEPWPEHFQRARQEWPLLVEQLRDMGAQHAHTAPIHDFLLSRSFPVDIRHNAKIFREKLAVLAARRLRASGLQG
jgi:acyl-CoA synthetase (AMP-forming)/AMP-acid ligase II